MRIDRRQFLGGATAAGAAAAGLVRALPAPAQPSGGTFQHGVASGDPLPDGVIIWTRVTSDADTSVRWMVATDETLGEIVRQGEVQATAATDRTVHVDVTGLDPATTYHYAFATLGSRSPIGRTRTAPAPAAGPGERLRIGLVACSRWSSGYFNAYGGLAARELDLVVHVGDYIYEDGGNATREHEPAHPLRSLDDYRTRYAQYRTDPDLQELHRRHPMVSVWDDHELAGNSWRDGARDHDDVEDGPWPQRRDAAAQAWREWLPFRPPDPADPLRIWRALPYGHLADVVMLDTRLHGRDRQVDAATGTTAELDDPSRRLLGDAQRPWLQQRLTESTAVWKIVGNQVMLSPLAFPAPIASLEDAYRERGFVVGDGEGRNPDQWDGYSEERRQLLDAIGRGDVRNVVVLTGDIHSSFVSDVAEGVVELVAPSVTSANFDELLGSAGATGLLESALRSANPHLRFAELQSHGYVVLDLTAERLQADWWFVDRLDARDGAEHHGSSWVVDALATAPATEADEPSAEPEPAPGPTADGEPDPDGAAADDGADGDDRVTIALGGAGAVAAVAGGAVLALRRRRSRDGGSHDGGNGGSSRNS